MESVTFLKLGSFLKYLCCLDELKLGKKKTKKKDKVLVDELQADDSGLSVLSVFHLEFNS